VQRAGRPTIIADAGPACHGVTDGGDRMPARLSYLRVGRHGGGSEAPLAVNPCARRRAVPAFRRISRWTQSGKDSRERGKDRFRSRLPLQCGNSPLAAAAMFPSNLRIAGYDPELADAIASERQRQEDHVELIASENYASPRVLEAQGSVLTNKYAEGYPGKRYYGGCEYVDVAERLAIARARELFDCDYANVQPH